VHAGERNRLLLYERLRQDLLTTPVRNRLQLLGRLADHVGRRFVGDGCFSLAGGLAYTSLLALVPLVTIALTVIAAFPVFKEFTQGIDSFFAQNMLPPAMAKAITGYINQFTENAGRLTAVGVVFLGVTAIMLMMTIEAAFNAIWRVQRPRPLLVRVLVYWGVLTLAPLLIGVSLTATSYLVSASLGYARQIPGGAALLLGLVPLALTALAFTLAYLVVPNRPVQLRHAAVGGCLAALMFELMKRAFAIYVAKVPSYTLVYGAFATIPIFLLWIYLSWVVALLGAVIAAALPDLHVLRSRTAAPAGAQFRDALEILRVLVRAQMATRTPRTREVFAEAHVPREGGERLLDELAAAGWVARVVGDRWTLACDPDHVMLAQVYERLVLAAAGTWRGADAVLDDVMERAAAGAGRAIGMPLRSLLDEDGGPSGKRVEDAAPAQKRAGRQEEPTPRAVGSAAER
jgi:membrane protein